MSVTIYDPTLDQGSIERYGIVDWVKVALPKAIEFAERGIAETARARKYHLDRAVERGTCAVGHDFTQGPGPHWTGIEDEHCGYCLSAIEHKEKR